MARKLTKELVAEIASKFHTRYEFQRADGGAYNKAYSNGWIEEICRHMSEAHRTLDNKSIAEIAKRFSTRTAFANGDCGAYSTAKKRGILEQVCSHMDVITGKWTKENVIRTALQFSMISELQREFPGAYNAAKTNNWTSEAFSHMQEPPRRLGKHVVIESAKKFATKQEFRENDGSAYEFARINGFLREACEHMPPGASGFNPAKKAYLYQIEFILPCGKKVWKVGITNRTPKKRMSGLKIRPGILSRLTHSVLYENGHDAKNEEKRLHSEGRINGDAYDGDPFLGNGNTELFSAPLLH
jgi:hypothetical protein